MTLAHPALRRAGLMLLNLTLALMFGLFAYAHWNAWLDRPRPSVLLILVAEILRIAFVLVRKDPVVTSHTWSSWISTVGAGGTSYFLRPVSLGSDSPLGEGLQIGGLLLVLTATVYLNRSFGLLPAYRRLSSGGPYGWIRHPMYGAYTVQFVGYLLNHPSLQNLAVVLIVTIFQVLRIRNEERLLMRFEDYARYAARTRWRLIPRVW